MRSFPVASPAQLGEHLGRSEAKTAWLPPVSGGRGVDRCTRGQGRTHCFPPAAAGRGARVRASRVWADYRGLASGWDVRGGGRALAPEDRARGGSEPCSHTPPGDRVSCGDGVSGPQSPRPQLLGSRCWQPPWLSEVTPVLSRGPGRKGTDSRGPAHGERGGRARGPGGLCAPRPGPSERPRPPCSPVGRRPPTGCREPPCGASAPRWQVHIRPHGCGGNVRTSLPPALPGDSGATVSLSGF